MKKKSTSAMGSATSILGVVVAVVLLIVVCITLSLNILFAQHDTPKIFGNYVYLMDSDSMEVKSDDTATVDASASIHANTAVICKAYDGSESLSKNNAILCVLDPEDTSTDKDSEGLAVRRILNIASDEETGVMKYYPTTMQTDTIGTEPAITAENIRGICRYESSQLYSFIHFATGFGGIVLLLALPCIILVVLLIVVLVRRSAKKRDDAAYAFEESYDELPGEEDYNYEEEEYEDDSFVNETPQTNYQTRTGNTGTYPTGNYATGTYPTGSYPTGSTYNAADPYPANTGYGNTGMTSSQTAFETKKSSISQNFERKAVNPNSAFQKAKTMQFQAQKNVQIPETSYGSAQQTEDNGYVGKYSAGAEVEPTTPLVQQPETTAQQTYHGAHEATDSAATTSRTFRSSATSTFKKPNVDDIFGSDPLTRTTSSTRQRTATQAEPASTRTTRSTSSTTGRRSYDKTSVDDLVAMIENEKKRL